MTRAGARAPALSRVHTADLSSAERAEIHALLLAAFDQDFSDDDWDHALGGLHVVCRDGDTVVGHAALVQRQVHVGPRVHRIGYVEAVAVSADAQRRGIGGLLMASVEEAIVAAYDFGALAASSAGLSLYRGRGWRSWLGPLSVAGPQGTAATPDDAGAVMVFGPAVESGSVDLWASLTADDRRGDPW